MIVRLMGWELNISWYTDFLFGEVVKKFGYEKAKEFFPNYPEDKPFIVSDSREKVIEKNDTLKKTTPKVIPTDKNKPKKKTADIIEENFKNLDEMYEQDKIRHEQMLKSKAQAKAKGELDTTGLTSVEISVLKLLDGGKSLTVDSMSHLGIPLPKLLSVLTLLEIKRRITQLPGGYFEINKDF
jgi:predicted Rossmann fold nucleotide-binding protein DprA/Smf involved in DNA uptake